MADLGVGRPVAVVGEVVEGLGSQVHVAAAGVGVDQALADVVLDGRVVGHAHAHVVVHLAGGVVLGDVHGGQADAVPAGRLINSNKKRTVFRATLIRRKELIHLKLNHYQLFILRITMSKQE